MLKASTKNRREITTKNSRKTSTKNRREITTKNRIEIETKNYIKIVISIEKNKFEIFIRLFDLVIMIKKTLLRTCLTNKFDK